MEPSNQHLYFFKGLLPSLVDFNEFDTINFEMGELEIIRAAEGSTADSTGPQPTSTYV